jgi:hypothetical protein
VSVIFFLESTENKLLHPTPKGDDCSCILRELFKVDLGYSFFAKVIDTDDELRHGVLNWLHSKAKYFCTAGISALPDEGKNVSV